ncbi:CopG family transcriptional regulator [Pigmentiphaga aceris]|uniref:CopG family transcriptional regulator n=1 Tax=Pigmentiphaga aceris TaxID=1940612 RepID=A0A5C0B4X8_9BURK|nr:DUF411 domain-containing protein [Pigmentiphaga aceris]QEI08693.1 CopG family transcriptional regulator [Pigmentiphaga aceris]
MSSIRTRHLVRLAFAGLLLAGTVAHAATPAVLYKTSTCGCCTSYVTYLREQGIEVDAIDQDDLSAIKSQHGSSHMASCHTMRIGGYTVEGHVPVAAIRKLLQEKPAIVGISVPGMPMNSPGMGPEVKGTLKVFELSRDARATPKVFSVE